MEKKFKFNKRIGVLIILAIILIASIIGVLLYNKFEFNIIGNERQEAKATGDNFIQKWKKSVSFTIGSVLGTKVYLLL